ncbi:MAG TPA: prepilin-type N-terminal cleavage/methylation domain-containing protein [Candidatus Paceibacterota bacterium]|jgi:type II secretion system protein G|nr:prepilin-type N-terminal cleavage/methylation domain-containing protein [Candidatus Paceibacterota bacterium]
MKKSLSKGFTLLELLTVIAIIGLLASVVVVSINTSRTKARDSQRINDLRQIRIALELYYNENGYYPPAPCGYDCNGYFSSNTPEWSTLASYLSPYIATLPVDPKNTGTHPWTANEFTYTYGNVGRYTYSAQYDLTTKFESSNNPVSCGRMNYKFFFNNSIDWCGSYSVDLYEMSP